MIEAYLLNKGAKFPGAGALLYIDPSDLVTGSTAIVDRSGREVPIANNGNVVVADYGPEQGVKSLYFKGDQYRHLRMPWQSFPNMRTGDFTIDFLYCPETRPTGSAAAFGQWLQIAGQGGFIAIINDVNAAFSFGPDSDYTPMFQVSGGNPVGWTRHTFVREGDRFQYYQNTILIREKTIAANGPQIEVDFTLGAYFFSDGNIPQGSGVPLSGFIAKLGLWNVPKYPS